MDIVEEGGELEGFDEGGLVVFGEDVGVRRGGLAFGVVAVQANANLGVRLGSNESQQFYGRVTFQGQDRMETTDVA